MVTPDPLSQAPSGCSMLAAESYVEKGPGQEGPIREGASPKQLEINKLPNFKNCCSRIWGEADGPLSHRRVRTPSLTCSFWHRASSHILTPVRVCHGVHSQLMRRVWQFLPANQCLNKNSNGRFPMFNSTPHFLLPRRPPPHMETEKVNLLEEPQQPVEGNSQ